LPLAPVEEHLITFEGADAEEIDLALSVLALLPFTGRRDAVPILRRYATEGRHWQAAVDAIYYSGAFKLPGLWDGFAEDIADSHDDTQLAEAIWLVSEPWITFARSQPRIRRLVEQATAAAQQRKESRAAGSPPGRTEPGGAGTEDLLQVIASGGPGRSPALIELGRRGELLVLDLAEDPGLRNAAGWIPGMPRALHHLGPAAIPRARLWISADSTLARFGERVLAEYGDTADIPVLHTALQSAMADGDWCGAETPARGLGRLHAARATPDLISAWQMTVHSRARADYLQGLQGCAPQTAEPFTEEGLFDCESLVQRLACTTARDSQLLRSRLHQLAQDPLTPETHDAADTRLTALLNTSA
jgi:hypothetical protein